MNKVTNGIDNVLINIRNMSYFEKHATSIIFVTVLMILFIIAIVYLRMSIQFQPIKDNWAARRCEPLVIPFAGLINKPHDMGVLEFTNENFVYCMNKNTKAVSKNALPQLNTVTNGIVQIYSVLLNRVQNMRKLILHIRKNISLIVIDIYKRLLNTVVPLQQTVMDTQRIFRKSLAVNGVGLKTINSLIKVIQSNINRVNSDK